MVIPFCLIFERACAIALVYYRRPCMQVLEGSLWSLKLMYSSAYIDRSIFFVSRKSSLLDSTALGASVPETEIDLQETKIKQGITEINYSRYQRRTEAIKPLFMEDYHIYLQ